MKTRFLFPNRFKRIGWIILIPSIIIGFIYLISPDIFCLKVNVFAILSGEIGFDNFSLIRHNIVDEIICIFLIIGAFLVGFSKEKIEDEFIEKVRLESLLWSVYINYSLLFLAIIFIYGMPFLDVMVFNMFTTLIIFIFRFKIILFINSNKTKHEE